MYYNGVYIKSVIDPGDNWDLIRVFGWAGSIEEDKIKLIRYFVVVDIYFIVSYN